MDLRIHPSRGRKTVKPQFKPKVVPRLITTKLNGSEVQKDLINYNVHRLKVFQAKKAVDNNPPKMDPLNYINLKKIQRDVDRMMEIDKQNQLLVTRINKVHQAPASVGCWQSINTTGKLITKLQVDKVKTIVNHNLALYRILENSKSIYSTKILKERWRHIMKNFLLYIKFPQVLHAQKPYDAIINESASITEGLNVTNLKFPRPKVFLEFKMHSIFLGRIIIEVYNDFHSETVENFLKRCCPNPDEFSFKDCSISYGEKCKFFNSGLTPTKDYVFYFNDKKIPCVPNNLKHNRVGVVSAVPFQEKSKFVKGALPKMRTKNPIAAENTSAFSITLKSMPEWDGRRTVIGKVIKGNKTLHKINDMLKKCGTPLVPIAISDCGIIPFTSDELHQFNFGDEEG